MGLNLGGIYIQVTKGVTQQSIQQVITLYWKKLGARQTKEDPLNFKPLSLEKTAKLGFMVLPPVSKESGWISVYDSERYHADPALARHLAHHFETHAWFWQIAEASNSAYAKRYGENEKVINNFEKVYELVEDELKVPFMYYNRAREDYSEEVLAECCIFGFEDIPYRPKAQYSGPSPEQLLSNDLVSQAEQFVRDRDVESLLKIADNHDVYYKVIHPTVENGDLSIEDLAELIYRLGPLVIEKKGHNNRIAELSLRKGDKELFEKAVANMPSYASGLLESRAMELEKKGEKQLAFLLMEAVVRSSKPRDTAWGRALYCLLQVLDNPGISEERVQTLLNNAEEKGHINAIIYFNLACYHGLKGNKDLALLHIQNTLKNGYDDIDLLKKDEAFDNLRNDPDFEKAFEVKEMAPFEDLVVENGEDRWVTPSIGFNLYFKDKEALPSIAGLIAKLKDDFPEMFTYYHSSRNGMEKVKKGKVARDITTLRKNQKRSYDIYYNADKGNASEQRFYLDDHDNFLALSFPLQLADTPDELYNMLKDYCEDLPFVWGQAGYALTLYKQWYSTSGPDTKSKDTSNRLVRNRIGLCVNPDQAYRMARNSDTYVIPGWLTFLNKDCAEQLPNSIVEQIAPATLETLEDGKVIIRAANAPFVGYKNNLSESGSFQKVVKALEPLLPKKDKGYEGMMLERLKVYLEA